MPNVYEKAVKLSRAHSLHIRPSTRKTEIYEAEPGHFEVRMGCDIHMVLEVKHEDRWIGINDFRGMHVDSLALDDEQKPKFGWIFWRVDVRNYELFGKLASVRRDGPNKPRGIPDDVSELAKVHIQSWGPDGHSHSWGLLSEIGGLFLAACDPKEVLSENRHAQVARLFGMHQDEEAGLDKYRLVYWFDN